MTIYDNGRRVIYKYMFLGHAATEWIWRLQTVGLCGHVDILIKHMFCSLLIISALLHFLLCCADSGEAEKNFLEVSRCELLFDLNTLTLSWDILRKCACKARTELNRCLSILEVITYYHHFMLFYMTGKFKWMIKIKCHCSWYKNEQHMWLWVDSFEQDNTSL